MAITIIKNLTQNKFYPSANPINVTVDSNNSGKCNFRFICDVYINNIKVFTTKIFPDPTTGYGFFQLSRVLTDYVKTEVNKVSYTSVLNSGASTTAPSSSFLIQFKFGEEYDNTTTCDGDILQYTNLSTSNSAYLFEAAIDYEEFPTFNASNYLIGTQSAQTLFLTNVKRELDITYNEPYSLDFISLISFGTASSVEFKAYNYTGGFTQSNFTNALGSKKRFRIACGPIDINRIVGTPIINPLIDYYTIRLLYNGIGVSETFRFNVRGPKVFSTRIAFVGLLGGIEHFTFYHRRRNAYQIERKEFKKLLNSNYSGDWSYQVGDRGSSVYGVNAQSVHNVSSFCTRGDTDWLYEMWLSKAVFTYKRPELFSFRPYQDGLYVNFWVDGEHGFEVGDTLFTFTENSDFNDDFTVTSVSGNIVNCNLLWSVYGATVPGTCGFIHKNAAWQILPIVISDNSIEVKQKTERPIEYALNYQMAYSKTTLR